MLNIDGTVTRYRIHSDVRPNFDLTMSDAEFFDATVPIVPKQNRFTPEEDEQIWNYMTVNYERYTKGSESFWRKLIEQTNSIRGPNVFLQRFNKALLPQLHKAKLPIETKLKLYKKLQYPVNKDFLQVLHRHADLQMGPSGVITDYQLHQIGGQKRKNEEEEADFKRPKASETPIQEQFVPETSPEVIVLKNPKEEAVPTYFEQEGRTEEEDYQNYEYQEPEGMTQNPAPQEHLQMAHQNYPQDLLHQNPYHPYHQNLNHPGGSGTVPAADQERIISEIDKMKDELDQKLNGLAKSMRKSLDRRVSEISRSVNSMHHEMKGEIKNMRKDLKTGLQDQSNGPSRNMREYLLNLKKLVSSMDSPDMESVEQRIDSALLNYPDGDETQLPIRVLKSAFDAGLTMIGH